MDINEFLEEAQARKDAEIAAEQATQQEEDENLETENIDVQKAVVEALAADKAVQDEKIIEIEGKLKKSEQEIYRLHAQIAELKKALGDIGDKLAANVESPLSSNIALIDRPQELSDRFSGETRDHVLEVIKNARDEAEKEGHVRRAQILEGVLLMNQPSGELQKQRASLEKLFTDNGNILTGAVIKELENRGISHKNGEEYLLPSEIINRTY